MGNKQTHYRETDISGLLCDSYLKKEQNVSFISFKSNAVELW